MRVSTKFAPRKTTNGEPLTCTSETTLKPEQLLELYRYLKLTRLVEERIVNLYRQTKVVGGVFRSLGQEATAVFKVVKGKIVLWHQTATPGGPAI